MFETRLNCNVLLPIPLTLILLVILGIITFVVLKRDQLQFVGGLSALAGGTLNLISRLSYGCVKDNLNFLDLFRFNFPDLLVTFGVFLILFRLWKKKS